VGHQGFVQSRRSHQEVREHPGKQAKDQDIKELIRDDAMWEKTDVACDLMDPVNRALAILEKDNATPSTAFFLFKELAHHETYGSAPAVKYIPPPTTCKKPRPLPTVNRGTTSKAKDKAKAMTRASAAPATDTGPKIPIHEGIQESIMKRWNYVHTSAMGITLLDQTRSTRELYGDDYVNARADTLKYARSIKAAGVLEQDGNDFLASLSSFEMAKEMWTPAERTAHCNTSPFQWWYNQHHYPELREVALRIFSICTSMRHGRDGDF
jgi:hypothetical protein